MLRFREAAQTHRLAAHPPLHAGQLAGRTQRASGCQDWIDLRKKKQREVLRQLQSSGWINPGATDGQLLHRGAQTLAEHIDQPPLSKVLLSQRLSGFMGRWHVPHWARTVLKVQVTIVLRFKI